MQSHRLTFAVSVAFTFLCIASEAAEPVPEIEGTTNVDSAQHEVDFARDIRPILSDACYHCHGLDENNREAGLRLDSAEFAAEDLGGYAAIVPGNSADSEAWVRITSDDEDLVMPPPESGKSLSAQDVDLLRRWIDQGAAYAPHWAFTPPKKENLPSVDLQADGNEIDAFVLARLRKEGLEQSPQADKRTLIRRLSLDLIGLPPTPKEVQAFLLDESPESYSKLVERLLASKHYGERWGRVWLDAARYADSDGFEKDKPRFVYFYRDWVCESLNQDMPFDQFVIRQIAGDLLPNPTQDDFVATGFLRNSMVNEEGGIDPEQFRMEAMYDRMDAIGKSVLGLTIQCAQCHSHKYDPISHTEYYSLFAMLNNCHEANITVYSEQERAKLRNVRRHLDQLREQMRSEVSDLESDFQTWIEESSANLRNRQREALWKTLEIDFNENTIGGQKFIPQGDGSYLAQGYAPTRSNPRGDATVDLGEIQSLRLELLCDPNLPHGGPGRSIDGTWALSEIQLSYSTDAGKTWQQSKFAKAVGTIQPTKQRLGALHRLKKPDPKRSTGPIAMAIDGDDNTAWTGSLGPGRRNDPHTGWFELEEPIVVDSDRELRVRVTLKQRHGGWNSDDNQNQNLGRFRVSVSPDAVPSSPMPPLVEAALLANSGDKQEEARLLDHYVATQDDLVDWSNQFEKLWKDYPKGTSQLVVLERDESRKTFRLERGDFLSPREQVDAGVPEFLHELPKKPDLPNRLDLAKWLVDEQCPTTARSIVNRVWQAYFGVGLTATPDDLGMQGEPPTHPELLDWLAADLMENDWSLKELHRRIVHSATYRQTSKVSSVLQQRDPDNRLLARGPRYRVPAEMVRDIALKTSGLLNPQIGGRSVYPPAPSFLFTPPASYGPKTWNYEKDAQKYRRGFYTFRFRSVPYPAFQAFDAPTGEVACVRRSRSNTPLQALVTLNEPLFVECAQHLARITMDQAFATDAERLQFVFECCLSRQPEQHEIAVLQDLLAKQRRRMANQPELASQLSAAVEGENRYECNERAAWTAVCRVVLNLDETITKQ